MRLIQSAQEVQSLARDCLDVIRNAALQFDPKVRFTGAPMEYQRGMVTVIMDQTPLVIAKAIVAELAVPIDDTAAITARCVVILAIDANVAPRTPAHLCRIGCVTGIADERESVQASQTPMCLRSVDGPDRPIRFA